MIKGISHLGIAVKDMDKARDYYRTVFGLESREPIVGAGGTVKASLIDLDNVVLELLSPIGTDVPVAKFIQNRGEGIQHVCYEVDDIKREIERFKAINIETIGNLMDGAEGLSIFLHPKGTMGILTELVEKRTQG